MTRSARFGICVASQSRNRGATSRGSRRTMDNVALDQSALCDNRHRMIELGKNRKDAPHDPPVFLDRLIGIGIGADRNGLRNIPFRRKLRPQDFGGIWAGDQPRLEIEARRKAEVGVARAGKAIDAAMLAAAKGIDGVVKGNVG